MKTVRGVYKQYQLVEKTKKKDLDGVVYLVAGERSLWVKLLKDRSAAKQNEIMRVIAGRGMAGFEKPLEIVNDSRGFAGYTFRGPEMEIVPEKKIPESNKGQNLTFGFQKPENNQKDSFSENSGFSYNSGNREPQSSSVSKSQQFLVLILTGIIMAALNLLFLNNLWITLIYNLISETAGEGCQLLSVGGILPVAAGIAVLFLYHRSFGGKTDSFITYIAGAVIAFLVGEVAAYGIIGILYILILVIFGAVQAYQSVIVTVIVVIFFIAMFIPRKK